MNRDFKGIWIPREIWLDKNLTLQEKVFYVEIDSLNNERGCYANNNYFAEFFGISTVRVSEVINSLVRKGYLSSDIDQAEGNKRILRTLLKVSLRGVIKESLRPSQRKVCDPIKDSFIHNNTENNTTNISLTLADNDYPFSDLFTAFPEVSFTPAHLGLIASEVRDTPADRTAWASTITLYKGNYDPFKNSYRPEKVGTLLNVFKAERSRLEKEKNGINQSNKFGRKRTDADVFAESATFYDNYPA
jgi:hypothetical protein